MLKTIENKLDASSKRITDGIIKSSLIEWRNLEWLQGGLKKISNESFAKLKRSLIKNNFIQPFNVWQDRKGVIWILDGHHRKLAMTELEHDGYTIPDELRANFIHCEDKKHASQLVLVYSSIYAGITNEGLSEFISEYNLDLDDIKIDIEIPSFDFDELSIPHDEDISEPIDNESSEPTHEPTIPIQEPEVDRTSKCPNCGFEIPVTKYNVSNHPCYRIWNHIKGRCYNENDKDYKYYGKRGIQMYDEWLNNYVAFYNWAIANGYSEGLTIDRINNDGNYEPGNCRFITREDNNRNKGPYRKKESQPLADDCNAKD